MSDTTSTYELQHPPTSTLSKVVAVGMGLLGIVLFVMAVNQATLTEEVKRLRLDLNKITEQGSPMTDKRLTVLEYKVGIR